MTFLETAVRTIAATIGGVAVFGYVYLYSIILNHSRFWLLCIIIVFEGIPNCDFLLFCLRLNGKLYPNFVEPRSCRNSCWSCSFGSLGQMQRRSCSKYHLILNNYSIYELFFLLNQNYYYHSIFEIQIPVLHGCIVEGVATLLCRLTSKFLSDKEPQYSAAIDSFVATSLVVAGM